jgi:hypothetical protein
VIESRTCRSPAATISLTAVILFDSKAPLILPSTSTKIAQPKGMPLTIGSKTTGRAGNKSRPAQRPQTQSSEYVIGEINAFIAIRDELLAEVEDAKTSSKLDSLIIANNFVESCLTPARSPYDVQFLPEPAAKRERERCEQIKQRVADLRDQIVR